MKFVQILNETPTDIVARFYKEANSNFDQRYNNEDYIYKSKTKQYYADNFESWKKHGVTPVFDKPAKSTQPNYTTVPKEIKLGTPGHRGLERALIIAGISDKKLEDIPKHQTQNDLSAHAIRTLAGKIN